MYKRPIFGELLKRFAEPRRFMQVLIGPRQVGKTTIASQLAQSVKMPVHSVSCDEPEYKSVSWIEQQWQSARIAAGKNGKKALLIIDEIQKIQGWSETVKKLWDEDTKAKTSVYVLLLGSSSMLIQKGLGDSLAGRFEVLHASHWSFGEMSSAFGISFDQYTYYGGYPGAAALINNSARWGSYISESLIETTVSKDILQMTRVDKPALLRRLLELGCSYSGQVLSYTKIMGQLQDAGNTTTLAHYLDLLSGAGILCGLNKYSGQKVRQRGSSPKFQVYDNALITVQSKLKFSEAKADAEFWGRLTESCIGSHLLNSVKGKGLELFYWEDGSSELDFVLAKKGKAAAIEVKSGRKKQKAPGIDRFSKEFNTDKKYLVGTGGIPFEEFVKIDIEELI
ncbi:MAG: AAA family ATPase [Candidatus Goldiibacteriota bacterium HGW-Goldbacteria-1]|jgi:hypothetical protein|nr:MAG: AAA family ATPase [Candidatus Goldiibacteriota bacterium HGW-Goldbacteria-1]